MFSPEVSNFVARADLLPSSTIDNKPAIHPSFDALKQIIVSHPPTYRWSRYNRNPGFVMCSGGGVHASLPLLQME